MTDKQEIINKRKALGSEFEEMIALGWTDEEAHDNEEGFFERIGDYADGLTHEDVWEVWEAAWEYKMEEAERVSNSYYYIYLYNNESITLYKGELDENGEKDRDTEEEILSCRYSDIDVNPLPETDDEREEGWKKIDAYIEEQLGFLPDYEVN